MVIIRGYGEAYAVTRDGRVFSRHSNRFIATYKINTGYIAVRLCYKGRVHSKTVHRLVAQAYLESDDTRPFVNHKDFNKTNNDVSNLEWVTRRENVRHAQLAGRMKGNPRSVRREGGHNGNARLSMAQVHAIRRSWSRGSIGRELAQEYKVSVSTISAVVNRRTWA